MRLVLLLTLLATAAHAAPKPTKQGKPAAAAKNSEPKQRAEPKTKLVFVQLPGGSFHFGCEKGDACAPDEQPGSDQTVKSFWMGKTEVTAAAYELCVKAHVCNDLGPGLPASCNFKRRGEFPMNCVQWAEAGTFCKWLGGRLPTAVEWEYAAKGGQSRYYPWGNEAPTGSQANFCDIRCTTGEHNAEVDDGYAESAPVGSYPQGATAQGLLDMAGNVWEWTSTEAKGIDLKEVRGGGWNSNAWTLRNSHRAAGRVLDGREEFGFRCVFDK